MYQFQHKLKHTKEKIKKWNKETFGNITQAKLDLERKIEEMRAIAMEQGHTKGNKEKEIALLKELNLREK